MSDQIFYLEVAARVSSACFVLLLIMLFLIRLRPIAVAPGLLPQIVALGNAFLLFALLLLPRPVLPYELMVTGVALVCVGNAGVLLVLPVLGRSFSILPQARRLVVHGPYRLVRHPLYLTEQIVVIGLILQWLSTAALLLYLAQLALLLVRIEYEEQVLLKAFPEYATYRQQTARLIPWLY